MDIDDLSVCVCMWCNNSFYVYELPLGINDPKYCPYCGISFEQTIDISENEQ